MRFELFCCLLTATLAAATESYDEGLAKYLVQYASAAYCPEQVSTWTGFFPNCTAGTVDFEILETYSALHDDDNVSTSTVAFAYVGLDTKKKQVIGAFKGSSELQDFITDARGLMRMFKFSDCVVNDVNFGRVHKGFCQYYQDLANMGFAEGFIKAVNKNPSYTPVLTGHSLGATAAVLAARDVNERAGITPLVYTFGQPRVGNFDFSSDFVNRVDAHYRVVHGADVVPHLAPCCWGPSGCRQSKWCPYHTWEQVWYDNDMQPGDNFTTCDGGEDFSCSKPVDLSVNDHLHYFGYDVGQYCCAGALAPLYALADLESTISH